MAFLSLKKIPSLMRTTRSNQISAKACTYAFVN